MGQKFLTVLAGLVSLGLVSCSTPVASQNQPSTSQHSFTSPTPSVSASTDWDALNQEEINDPSPLANSTAGPSGDEQVTIKDVSYSVIGVTTQKTVDLMLEATGHKDGTYGPERGGSFYKVEVGVTNESIDMNQGEFIQPSLWAFSSAPRVCLETKENILVACVEDWSHRVDELWKKSQGVPPGESMSADYYFDVPYGLTPAYLTLIPMGQKTLLNHRVPPMAPVDRIRLSE